MITIRNVQILIIIIVINVQYVHLEDSRLEKSFLKTSLCLSPSILLYFDTRLRGDREITYLVENLQLVFDRSECDVEGGETLFACSTQRSVGNTVGGNHWFA